MASTKKKKGKEIYKKNGMFMFTWQIFQTVEFMHQLRTQVNGCLIFLLTKLYFLQSTLLVSCDTWPETYFLLKSNFKYLLHST